MPEIRSMREEDLDQVAEVSDQAFIAVIAKLYGQRLERPFFPLAGLALRLWTDPDGCLVFAERGQVVGALFSVARGTVGWFGPVAVASIAQGQGAGQALVAECLRRWSKRRVRMLGLETFPSSGFLLSLVAAAEEAARAAGKTSLAVRLPGTAWTAFQALVDRGYRAGPSMLRMKAGEHLDYDRDAWYADDWL